MGWIRKSMGIVASAAALGALPAVATAADTVSDYHPSENAREFGAGAGGWEGSTSVTGLCAPDLTCPTVTNSYVGSGGTGGANEGHLRTEVANLAGVDSRVRGIWRSPPFVYRGAEGQTPTEVTFELARRTQLSSLISGGGSASYSAELVRVGSGVARTMIDDALLEASEGWTLTPEVSVSKSSLEIGAEYRIRVITTVYTQAQASPAGFVDYDDVRLRAVRANGDGSGGGGGGGAGGGGGGAGGGGNGAVLDGKRLFLRLKCLGVRHHGRCKVRAVAYTHKNGARATFPIERRVRSKRGKKVTMRVRPRFVKQVSRQKAVLVRSQVKAGERKKTKYKRYKLIEQR